MGKDKNVDEIQKTNKPRRQLWVQKQMSFRSNSIEAKNCENNELKILKDPSSSLMNNVVPNERQVLKLCLHFSNNIDNIIFFLKLFGKALILQ